MLGEFEQLIMWAVLRLGDQAYGVGIATEIEQRTGRDVSPGAIYTALGRLEDRGLVRSRREVGGAGRAGRPRKFYRLEASALASLDQSWSHLAAMAEGQVTRLRALREGAEG